MSMMFSAEGQRRGVLSFLLYMVVALSAATFADATPDTAVLGKVGETTYSIITPRDHVGNHLRFQAGVQNDTNLMLMEKPVGAEIWTDVRYDDKSGGLQVAVRSTKPGVVRLICDVLMEGQHRMTFIRYEFTYPERIVCLLPVGSRIAVSGNQVVALTEPTVIKSGRTWVSAAEIARMAGYDVTQTRDTAGIGVRFTKEGRTISWHDGDREVLMGSGSEAKRYALPEKAQVTESTARLPVSTLCELLDLRAETGLNDTLTGVAWVRLLQTVKATDFGQR